MSTGFTVSWQGIDVLDERIDLLLDLATGAEITQCLMPGAELMADRWRELVDKAYRTGEYSTGRYHDSIKVVPGPTDEFGINSMDIETDAVNPRDQFPYPIALEYGTSRMEAHPTAQPAFDESVEEAIALAANELDILILARVV
jgi:hypothetical protein